MILNSTQIELETTKVTKGSSQRTAALVAGVGLVLMFFFAMFGTFFVLDSLVIPGDVATTAENIVNNEQLFRMGIASIIIVIILDVIVAWGLYVFLRPVNWSLSLLGGWFRLVYSAIFFVALINLVNVLGLLTDSNSTLLFAADQIPSQVMLSLNAFYPGWDAGLVIFGLHLVIVGYLVFTSGNMPRVLGLLVIIAGLGYTIDTFSALLLPGFGVTLSMFTFIGEVLLGFWLLIKGVRANEWEEGALKSV
jgi:hypothetical protein